MKLNVTGDGVFILPKEYNWPSSIIYVPDSLGAAIEVRHADDTTIGTLESASQAKLEHGIGAVIELVVSGYSAPFTIRVHNGG